MVTEKFATQRWRFGVKFLQLQVIHPKLICALGNNERKHPYSKMRFEVICHPRLDIWGHEKKSQLKEKKKLC